MSPVATAPSRKTILFQIQKKKFGGGKIQKMQRIVLLVGRALPATLQLSAFFLKIGSSGVVKFHQERTFPEIWAHLRSFFFGFAEQKPNVFRGEKRILGSRRLRLFAAIGGFGVKYKCTQIISAGFLLGFNSRPVQVRLAWFVCNRAAIKVEGCSYGNNTKVLYLCS